MKKISLHSQLFFSILVFLFFMPTTIIKAQQLENNIKSIKEKYELAGGTVVMFNKNKITNVVNFGFANLETDNPIKNNTLFRVASISKTITTIAFMQLVDQKKISLDDNISKVLNYEIKNPFYPDIAITPRMLLSHTSCLTDDPQTYDTFLGVAYEKNPVPNLSELMNSNGKYYSKALFLNQKPGLYFNYCNLNYGIIGTLIEKISGERFDNYCQKYIFTPLGINATYNVRTLGDKDKLAIIYRKIDGNWIPQCDNNNDKNKLPENFDDYITGTNAIRFAPQGGLRISGSDLAKVFTLFLNDGKYLNQQIISKASIAAMTTSQWKFDGTNGDYAKGLYRNWGLGIHLITNTKDNDEIFSGNVSMFGHSGDAYGLVSDAFVDVKKGNGFIFITNGSGNGYVTDDCSSFYAIEKEIFETVDKELKIPVAKSAVHK